MPAHLLLYESLPRRCHAARMKECATETTYDPDLICRCLRSDQVITSFQENTQPRTWTFCRAACHQSIVLSYPQGLLVRVSLTVYCTFSSPKRTEYRRLAFQNAKFGAFPLITTITTWRCAWSIMNSWMNCLGKEWSANPLLHHCPCITGVKIYRKSSPFIN